MTIPPQEESSWEVEAKSAEDKKAEDESLTDKVDPITIHNDSLTTDYMLTTPAPSCRPQRCRGPLADRVPLACRGPLADSTHVEPMGRS
eukprot:1010438-Prorocentrum_minimum.AAC.1